MRILIVKLSSLGDVVHALPVVADIRERHPHAVIDWVVEPGFAPIVRRTAGVAEVIACPLRRWLRSGPWRPAVLREMGEFVARLRQERYDAVIDLQGLTKSALIARLARGPSFGLANRTEGASHEAPARWLATRAVRVEPRSHAIDRSRELVSAALDTWADKPPSFGLRGAGTASIASVASQATPASRAAPAGPPVVALIHGSSRPDKLWPEACWIELGRRLVDEGWHVALPRTGHDEAKRARAIAAAIGAGAEVWPALGLDDFVERLAGTDGAIGIDSGPSHIAAALGLPHVQLYNFPTSWRTGPQARGGAAVQVSVEGDPLPSVAAVWSAWRSVQAARSGGTSKQRSAR